MSRTCSATAKAGRFWCTGKYDDGLIFLRPDIAEAVRAYLAARGTIAPDDLGEALIVADGNFAPSLGPPSQPPRRAPRGRRLPSRDQRIRPQVSNHVLPHTSATLA